MLHKTSHIHKVKTRRNSVRVVGCAQTLMLSGRLQSTSALITRKSSNRAYFDSNDSIRDYGEREDDCPPFEDLSPILKAVGQEHDQHVMESFNDTYTI